MVVNSEKIFTAIAFLKDIAEVDPNYFSRELFTHSECKEECLNLIEEIDSINEKLLVETDKSKKGNLTLEKGKILEKIAQKMLKVNNVFNIFTNIKCDSNEIDLLLKLTSFGQGISMFLPKELTDDIIVECKNYSKGIDVTWTGKLYSLMRYKNVKCAILFSYLPLKGKNAWDSSKGLIKKLYLKDDSLIINITIEDIKNILFNDLEKKEFKYTNIITLIQSKIDNIRYHTQIDNLIEKHPAELIENT